MRGIFLGRWQDDPRRQQISLPAVCGSLPRSNRFAASSNTSAEQVGHSRHSPGAQLGAHVGR
jgi:hypothetical protein